jgi:hypothetical protein
MLFPPCDLAPTASSLNERKMLSTMNLLRRFGYLLFLLSSAIPGRAQSGAQLTLSQATVTAGDTVNIEVDNLEFPASCDTNVQIFLDPLGAPGSEVSGYGPIKANSTSAKIPLALPKDLAGGDYHVVLSRLLPCPGFQNMRNFAAPPIVLSVKALPDTTRYPTRADLNLSVTQKQFFDTKIEQLDELDRQLTTRIEGRAADTQDLREILTATVNAADKALTATENQYFQNIMGGKGTPPAFFADFHAQYHALLVELKAPIPGTGKSEINAPSLVRVTQVTPLTKRPNSSKLPENLSGTYPPDVMATRQTMADNKSAYSYIVSSNRITFDIQFVSRPAGAQIAYKKLLDADFTDYSEPTDVKHATFELATWKFKFHKAECSDDQVRTINPYQDTKPVVSVEFSHCRGR